MEEKSASGSSLLKPSNRNLIIAFFCYQYISIRPERRAEKKDLTVTFCYLYPWHCAASKGFFFFLYYKYICILYGRCRLTKKGEGRKAKRMPRG